MNNAGRVIGPLGRRLGRIGVYGPRTRALQRRLSFEAFGLSMKTCNMYLYLGSRANIDPSIDDVQTHVFSETPDRAYARDPIELPVGMENFAEGKMDFSRLGLIDPLQDEQTFRFHIDDFVALGREITVGDVFELPFFEKNGDKMYWEVTDVDLKSETEKFLAIIHASPMDDSRSTREIPEKDSMEGIVDNFMENFDKEVEEAMDVQGLYKEDEVKPDTPVDYRDDRYVDFLDDPTKSF